MTSMIQIILTIRRIKFTANACHTARTHRIIKISINLERVLDFLRRVAIIVLTFRKRKITNSSIRLQKKLQ